MTTSPHADTRNIRTGSVIPTDGAYADQPYVVVTHEGTWLCVMTTGCGEEGDRGQHIISTISHDHGATWTPATDIEPPGPPESSWVMPLITPSGRIYVFYVRNHDDVTSVLGVDGVEMRRVDMLGRYFFRYSDDHGRSWSDERYEVPLRLTSVDRDNTCGGDVRFFWGVGKPIVHEGSVYIGLSRIGGFAADGVIASSEGIVLRSDDLLTQADPQRITWQTLPAGDRGLRAPAGPVAEEQSLASLGDGGLACTYRTVDGYLAEARSTDGGRTWDGPRYARFAANGRPIRHPRAAGFIRRFTNGRFLLWFHNQSRPTYMGRNPVWVAGGTAAGGSIRWSQPEILLYDDVPATRISYPDFIEDDGRVWVTATQKSVARVHEIDPGLLADLWHQDTLARRAGADVAVELLGEQCLPGARTPMPRLPHITPAGGISVELWVRRTGAGAPAGTLVDSRDRFGVGLRLGIRADGRVVLELSDGRGEAIGRSDPVLIDDAWHHVVVTVDGAARVMTSVVDGVLSDGGDDQLQGWCRFHDDIGDITGARDLVVADPENPLGAFRIYRRPLRTTEAIASMRTDRRELPFLKAASTAEGANHG